MAPPTRGFDDVALRLRKPPSLAARHDPYPYQLDAVRALQNLSYAAVFHEQGLGKTKIGTDLILVWLRKDIVDTSIVVTKKGLVTNWTEELRTHSHITPRVLTSNRRTNAIALNSPVLVYVTNYEVVTENLDLIQHFLRTCRVAAVLDESQRIKNPTARVSRAFHSLAPGFARRLIMTGTPVANRPHDIWSQIQFLDGGRALGESFPDFKAKLNLPRTEGSGGRYSRDLRAVWARISDFAVRETKETAGLELPSKTIRTHWVDLAPRQRAIYASYQTDMACELSMSSPPHPDDADQILTRLLRLVQCASNPRLIDPTYDERPSKLPDLLRICEEATHAGQKIIVWTSFVQNVLWLASVLRTHGAQPLHGRMSLEDRTAAVHAFKDRPTTRILVATPGAAKEGLTLTVASHAIFYDRSFALDDYVQAQDRIHRISQTSPCMVHNLIARGTIDEWVDSLLRAKYHAAQVLQGDIGRDGDAPAYKFDLGAMLKDVLTIPPTAREAIEEKSLWTNEQ